MRCLFYTIAAFFLWMMRQELFYQAVEIYLLTCFAVWLVASESR
jgi:hypothetical protein